MAFTLPSAPICCLFPLWFSRVRLFATPWTVPRLLSVHGISQARIPEWVAISFSRASSQPRDRIHFSWIARLTLLPRVTWEARWTEEPGGLEAMESQRVGHSLATEEPQGPIHCWHCVKKDSEDIWAQPGEALADQERGLGAGRRMGQDPRLCRGLSPPPFPAL